MSGSHPSSLHNLTPDEARSFSDALQIWYRKEARILPWRVPAVPYGSVDYQVYAHRVYICLVSETMLQQTQVATVIAYFDRWMKRFPTMVDVAEAPQDDVLKLWAGLGYYSRAKRLQEACIYLQIHYVSKALQFPEDVAEWIKYVPGVGSYTAGAILSIACGLPRAIVDGNVQRVLSRFLAIRGDTKTPKSVGSKLIWQQSAMLVEHAGDEPGTFNQALMELGATLCTPVKPSCGSCPVREACRAQRQYGQLKKASPFFKKRKAAVIESDVEDLPDICTICPTEAFALPVKKDFIESHYPLKIAKKQQRLEHALVVIVREGDTVYVERKQTGLLAGLYDFPTHILEDEPPDTFDKGLHMIGQTIHLFTHIRRQSTILTSKSLDILDTLPGTRTACADGIWIKQDALAEQGVSELCLKSWRIVTGEKKAMKKTFKDVA